MTPDDARSLMEQWTQNPALRVHMEAVASAMGRYADILDPANKDRWIVCGLLHDFDYERHPTPAEHPTVGVAHLATLGVDEEIRKAILGHAEYTNTPRLTPMARTLFAVDELCGFIVACCKVRPDGIASLEPASVRKKLKDKAFAAAVSRSDIALGIDELAPVMRDRGRADFDLNAHVALCIEALRANAERLAL